MDETCPLCTGGRGGGRRDGRLPYPRAVREVDAPEGEPGWREVRAQEAVSNVRGKREELAFVP